MAEKVYKWGCYFGRNGTIEGLFVADENAVEEAIGKIVIFYEALGKHSQPQTTLEEGEFEVLSEDPTVIEFVREHATTGYNPLHYIHSQCDICELFSNPEEVVTYECLSHGVDLCDGCHKHAAHKTCEVIELHVE